SPPSPLSTLFPYTTLFRSSSSRCRSPSTRPTTCRSSATWRRCSDHGLDGHLLRARSVGGDVSLAHPRGIVCSMDIERVDLPGSEDRNSTRLNSSHVGISYA